MRTSFRLYIVYTCKIRLDLIWQHYTMHGKYVKETCLEGSKKPWRIGMLLLDHAFLFVILAYGGILFLKFRWHSLSEVHGSNLLKQFSTTFRVVTGGWHRLAIACRWLPSSRQQVARELHRQQLADLQQPIFKLVVVYGRQMNVHYRQLAVRRVRSTRGFRCSNEKTKQN